MNEYNVRYAYVMLLEPVDLQKSLYRLVEAHQDYGTPAEFQTELTEGMLAVSFHSDDFGAGLERRELAKTLEAGSLLVLWGIDVQKNRFPCDACDAVYLS